MRIVCAEAHGVWFEGGYVNVKRGHNVAGMEWGGKWRYHSR